MEPVLRDLQSHGKNFTFALCEMGRQLSFEQGKDTSDFNFDQHPSHCCAESIVKRHKSGSWGTTNRKQLQESSERRWLREPRLHWRLPQVTTVPLPFSLHLIYQSMPSSF